MQNPSPYQAMGNNPVSNIDPDGRRWVPTYHVWVTVGDGKVTDISDPIRETNWVDDIGDGTDPSWDEHMSESALQAAVKAFQQAISEGNILAAEAALAKLEAEKFHPNMAVIKAQQNTATATAVVAMYAQVEGQNASGQGGFNEDKAISYLKNNFILPYGAGQCINNMVPALIEGGITGLKGKPIKAACLYGPILKNLGFVTVNRTNTYYKGDIAIIQGYDGGTYCEGSGVVCGHIQMYDGEQWISDFPQSRPFWPGKGYADATPSPSFEILNWGGN